MRTLVCRNMSLTDRLSRILLGLVLVGISPAGFDIFSSPIAGWFCFVFGITNIISAFVGWCFMYSLVGMRSSSAEVTEDESDAQPLENLDTLRRKVFFGFGLVTVGVSLLFILEGYSSAGHTSYQVELRQQYENLALVGRELDEHANEQGYSAADETLPSQTMLAHILKHFDASMLLVVGNETDSVALSKAMSAEAAFYLQSLVIQKKQHLDVSLLPELKDVDGVVREDSEKYLVQFAGNDYMWAISQLESLGFWYALVEQSHSKSIAFREVALRLGSSALVVIWLGLWGAYAVALFVWTRMERSNRQLMHAAETDALTGLMNERALKQACEELSASASSYYVAAVRFRNLHHIIADHGSEMTNRLLAMLGQRLRDDAPATCVLGRLNDGSIVLITPEGSDECLARFRQCVNEVQTIDQFQFALEPTEVGILYPDEAEDFDLLLKDISTLMLRANNEKVRLLRYDSELIESNKVRLRYATQLKQAIETKAFELFLQPKVDLSTGQCMGAEALIRWQHPVDGLLFPAQFLDVIENSNIRSEFAKYVATQAVLMLKRLEEQGYQIKIAFNLTAYDLSDEIVMRHLKQIMSDHDIEPKRLEVELTEQQTSVNFEKIKGALAELSACGYAISLDDFGTGMNSLAYCQQLPIDTIKIDRCFVNEVTAEPESQRIVKTILDLADNFGYSVVAEGIETETSADVLTRLKCNIGQGYYYGKPVPFAEFLAYINQTNPINLSSTTL
ncbi:EAL domain-containing protein [Neptuniibacter sp. CAU 1671]|uniref:EAL domain-containing protein n=1 Tax=Neptuniibacter sp. CAU 1671 TaxID=3032593 RepID=UPI0023DA0FDD|nr:EAL domain-containing protein [Neptuniibacter sp. CAU 1671]MDF2181307.1 EAL domain-containing protein [Neptuniibacter sp. CAU 1671]